MSEAGTATTSDAKWYIVHTYSNFEKKVAEEIKRQAQIQGLEDVAVDGPGVCRAARDVLVAEVLRRHRGVGGCPLELGCHLVVEGRDPVQPLAHRGESTTAGPRLRRGL